MNSGRVRVVSFDAGGTLITPWPSVGEVYAVGARALGLGELDPRELTARFTDAWRQRPAFDYSPGAWAGLVADTFRGLVAESEGPMLFTELYERFARGDAWRVFADVTPTLRDLHAAGYRLVVTSNWDERLRRLLAALRLADEFEWIGVSAEVGFHKPDARFFDAVARQIGAPAETILHVGDRASEDVVGARAAGWSAVLLDRKLPGHELPDRISGLTDLLALLASGGAEGRRIAVGE